jgi:hypothetical protein
MKRINFFFLCCLPAVVFADPPVLDNRFEEPVIVPWQESDYALPPYPKDENLVEFSVDAAPNSKAYIDKTAIGVGTKDNVIRYVLVVKTNGGAVNVSYEGVRCDTNEYRIYALGTQEKTWSEPRVSEWRPFKIHNRQQKSLANYYFCPNYTPIKSVEEGWYALRVGIHPRAVQRMQ